MEAANAPGDDDVVHVGSRVDSQIDGCEELRARLRYPDIGEGLRAVAPQDNVTEEEDM